MTFARRLAMVAVACLATAAPAVAGDPPAPAIAQYVETFPAAGGATVSGSEKPQVRELPKQIEQSVDALAGDDASALKSVATSSRFGAPQVKERSPSPRVHLDRADPDQTVPRGLRTAAPASLASDSGTGSLVALLLVLAVLTLGICAVAFTTRRSSGRRPVR